MSCIGNSIGAQPNKPARFARFAHFTRSAGLVTPRLRGYALLLAAIVLWGANWPVMKAGLAHVTPIWFSAVRFVLGAATLLALQGVTGTLRRRAA
ncbi:hypothetical protein CAL26_14165 [Bordetella genomosp. 9]|uniref:EamA domain-containing protein n=1 Tax=Bordetella genomosp. 9 TaxID=1416803 RepID=A0A261R2I7_9BORD|nr:EamA family transporter [Bordetella genomosp. 9]OZI18830.1 hypothetical protein CAL26_14165 [Bordetella genomosp. 9]